MVTQNMPEADVDVTPGLVRLLLHEQHPDLADRSIVEVANGWDNVIYRLGDDLAVRLPRRALAAVLVEHEQRVLPWLAERVTIPIPAPVRVGHAGLGYPWSWNIVPWFDGSAACVSDVAEPTVEARRLGEFLAELHVTAPDDAPQNAYRGHFVGRNTAVFLERIGEVADDLDALVADGAGVARRRWAELTDVTAFAGDPMWIHGDLHTANVLVHDGRISAVIDFGDVCAGDPATDLAVAWMLFDESDRDVLRRAAGSASDAVDDAMWQRAEAWALHFAVVYLLHSADNRRMATIGRDLFATLVG